MSLAPICALSLALLPPLAQMDDDLGGPDGFGPEPDVVQVDGDAEGGALALLGGGVCGLVFLAILLAGFAAFVWALVDIIKRDDFEGNMKIVWILVVLFGQLLGVAIYYFVGRKPAAPTRTADPGDRV